MTEDELIISRLTDANEGMVNKTKDSSIKEYVEKPKTTKAIQFFVANFKELLKNGWVDGYDRDGYYFYTWINNGIHQSRVYVNDTDFIIETIDPYTYCLTKVRITEKTFLAKYKEYIE